MIIRNANVLNTRLRKFVQQDLYIADGKITGLQPEDTTIFDAGGQYVIPGFIDTHIHGYYGCEFFQEGSDFSQAQNALAAQGITAFAATVGARPVDALVNFARRVAALMQQPQTGAKLCGIHSEGPFISEKRRGAMHPTGEECTLEAVQRLLDAAPGVLKVMTIAPERENAPQIIAQLKDRLAFSLGHTDATFEEATAAIDAGATRSTHTFNGMRPLYHRQTGVLGAVLTDDRVCCEMIADFIHLDPAVVKLLLRLKGADRLTLISDTGAFSGLPDGQYGERFVKDGIARNREGTIAGSCFSMLRGAQNLRKLGVSLEEISVMASWNPARLLGLTDTMGSIEPGKCADLIVCDDMLNLHTVFIDGIAVNKEAFI